MAESTSSEEVSDEDLEEIDFLCRQRDFEAARQIGQRLLQRHPTSARVHEVMGDISAAEGEHAEAVDWYETTLQLEPTDGVRDKLLSQRRQAGSEPTGRQRQERSARRRTLLLVLGGAAVVVVLVVLAAFALRGPSEPQEPASTQAERRAVTQRGPTASRSQAGRRTTASRAPRRPRTDRPRTSRSRSVPTREPKANYKLPPVILTNEVDAPLSQQDRKLLATLASLTWPGGANLSGRINVMTDPFSGYTFITVSVPKSARTSDMFNAVVHMAYRLARTAAKNDSSLRYFTIRFLVALEVQGDDRVLTVFRGNTNRKTLERYMDSGSSPGAREIWNNVFAEPWWNPSVPYDNPLK